MSSDSSFIADPSFNRNITSKILSYPGLTIYLRFRFGGYREAAAKANISYNRLKQLVRGINPPKTPKIIRRLAEAWEIDPIVLTQLFTEKIQHE